MTNRNYFLKRKKKIKIKSKHFFKQIVACNPFGVNNTSKWRSQEERNIYLSNLSLTEIAKNVTCENCIKTKLWRDNYYAKKASKS